MFLILIFFAGFLQRNFAVERGTIIPLYSYPVTNNGSDVWKPLKDAYSKYPIEVWAIVNCNSGPGAEKDAIYAKAIKSLKLTGIKTLGYVSTNYTKRSLSIVKKEIDNWRRWYGTHGIFLDEMTSSNTSKSIDYYSKLDIYAKSKNFTFTVGNPGMDVALGYFQAVDTVMIYESPSYPKDSVVCNSKYDSVRGNDLEALAIFPYNVPSLNESAISYAKNCLGYIYVTDDRGNNPWDTLPPYLTKLFQILSK